MKREAVELDEELEQIWRQETDRHEAARQNLIGLQQVEAVRREEARHETFGNTYLYLRQRMAKNKGASKTSYDQTS